ncbi:MAG: hypothetical protein MK226_18900 [Saprospiraceae bacterium]|nr:hypothetical protein [Saprospiraceae bacterium]
MFKITPLLTITLLFVSTFSFSQNEKSEKKRAVAREIFYKAQEGHQNFDPHSLLFAVELLLKNPTLQAIEIDSVSHIDTIPSFKEFNYFDIHELFDYVKKYAPYDDTELKTQIEEMDKRMPLQGMGPDDLKAAKIENGNYLIQANKSREISKSFLKEGLVNLTIEYGGELKLMVKDANGRAVIGQEQSNEAVKFLDFNVQKIGHYKIIIENKSTEEKDCFLTIESR